MILSEIIKIVRSGAATGNDPWLFISGEAIALTLDTDCELAELLIDEEANFEEVLPLGFEERGLWSTIDFQTLADCVRCADRLTGDSDPAACCEVIRYYIRFDAWPERLGAADPPPFAETIARLDRDFYDSLGPERPGTACRRQACSQGTVEFSALCKAHHFESVNNKPCPFER